MINNDLLTPDDSHLVDYHTKKFLEILINDACKYNIPFISIKKLSGSLIKYFSELSSENLLSNSLTFNLNLCINSTERFDQYLSKYFDIIEPEVINILNSDKNFVMFSFKKSIQFLIQKFQSFDQILSNSDSIIYINIFVDDFQVANPLLRKKSLKNQLTGIYFRIISLDSFQFSRYENLQILCLAVSSVFSYFHRKF